MGIRTSQEEEVKREVRTSERRQREVWNLKEEGEKEEEQEVRILTEEKETEEELRRRGVFREPQPKQQGHQGPLGRRQSWQTEESRSAAPLEGETTGGSGCLDGAAA